MEGTTVKDRIIGGSIVVIILLALMLSSCFGPTAENTAESEKAAINEYLAAIRSKGYKIDSTQSGLYFIQLEAGSGPFPQKGDLLTLEYTGYYINGNIFDSSEQHLTDGKYQVTYLDPAKPMLKGWEEGLGLMNKGRKIYLVIPSSLAYGASGNYLIAPYTTLVFVVKMTDIQTGGN